MSKPNKILLNIPHTSVNGIFDRELGGWQRNAFFINDCVMKLTDWYVDMLFATDRPQVSAVAFPYSRFVCDAERLENDAMEAVGQGIIYTVYEGYKREPRSEEQREKIMGLWHEHQSKLVTEIEDGSTVLLDCHSFTGGIRDCDICIGFNDDWSFDPAVVYGIERIFKKSGYSTAINSPHSNSITPKTDKRYSSVMIDINKRVYLCGDSNLLNRNPRQWMRWYGTINRIYDYLTELE
jgi:N-formylglutamate amidohydrolase